MKGVEKFRLKGLGQKVFIDLMAVVMQSQAQSGDSFKTTVYLERLIPIGI